MVHALQQAVEDLPEGSGLEAARRRLAGLTEKLGDMAHLHQWTDEADLIASLEELPQRARGPGGLRRHLRAGLGRLEQQLHARLLRTLILRLKGRRRS